MLYVHIPTCNAWRNRAFNNGGGTKSHDFIKVWVNFFACSQIIDQILLPWMYQLFISETYIQGNVKVTCD